MTSASSEFSALYAKYSGDVFRFAMYLCGEQSEADDITAETFARAWTSPSPVVADTVRAYLFTIARNICVQRAQRASRYVAIAEDTAMTRTGEREIEARHDLEAVRTRLATMHADDRAAVMMRAEGMSYEEIGKALGSSAGAARVRVHRARAILQRVRSEGAQP